MTSLSTPSGSAIAVCQHPDGPGMYVPAEDIKHGICFQAGCDCTPRVYVAVDCLLSPGAIVVVQQGQRNAGYEPPDDFDWVADILRAALRYVGVRDIERPRRIA